MAKINFTAERISAFQCEPGKRQSLLWDTKTPGLGLRASDGGSKSYIFEARLNGKTLRTTIGDVRSWTVVKAQAEATRWKAQVDLGLDPRQQREEQFAKNEAARSQAERRNLTLGEVWPIYLQDRKPRWSERHYADQIQLAAPSGQRKKRDNGKTVAGPLAPLMPLKLAELSASVLAEWAEQESAARPTNTTQSYRKLRAFIHWAESQKEYCGVIPTDSYKARKVRDAIPPPRAKIGDCLQREQLKDWFAAVRNIPNPVFSFYLQGLLLTGARREELAMLRWEDVDLKWRSLNIRDKIEGVRTIPLTPYFASLLLALKRINETPPSKCRFRQLEAAGKHWEPSAWVFSSSTSASGHIISPTQPHTDALVAAGLPMSPCMDCAVRSGRFASGWKCRAAFPHRSWGIVPARWLRSIIGAGHSICFASGTTRSKHGYSRKAVSAVVLEPTRPKLFQEPVQNDSHSSATTQPAII